FRPDAAADRGAEDDEIERGGDHRRDQALPDGPERARHFEAVDRPCSIKVHASLRSCTKLTKISSSELCRVCRSLKPMPRSRILPSREGMPVRSAWPSNT